MVNEKKTSKTKTPKQDSPNNETPEVQAETPAVTSTEKKIVSYSLTVSVKGWSVVRTVTQGDKILEQKITQPDLRAIAFEKFRTDVGRELMSQELK